MLNKLTFLDFEVANINNCSICQIGIVHVDGENMSKLRIMVNPDDEFDMNCVNIHHITKNDVKDAKTFDLIWPDIEPYFIDSIIIAHNALTADIRFLIKNLVRYKLDIPEINYICTLEIAKKYIQPFSVGSRYDLMTLCNLYSIDTGSHHDAFDDAFSCYQLFMKMENQFNLKIMNIIKKRRLTDKDSNFKMKLNDPQLNKAVNTLYGLIRGVVADHKVVPQEIDKLSNWVKENEKYQETEPFNEIIPALKSILVDNFISETEQQTLLNLVDICGESVIYSESTLGAQVLIGFLKGIIADKEIDEKELASLQIWLYENIHLNSEYPFNKVFPAMNKVLEDGIITSDEKDELYNLFEQIINPIKEMKEHLIRFENKTFCLTGEFTYGSKTEVAGYIESKNGVCVATVTKQTDFLIVGGVGSAAWSFGNYGTKVKKAYEMMQKGHRILIFSEKDLFFN